MDVFNRGYSQAVELLRSMTPAARVTTGLLLLLVVLSLAFLFRPQMDQADDFLFGGQDLSRGEIAEMEAAFSNKGLNGWEVVGSRIRVPHRQRNLYISAAREAGALPETPDTPWKQMFSDDNPLKSKQIRDLQASRALEVSLARTLEEMPGIVTARLQIHDVDSGEFPPRKERRCLVAIQLAGSANMKANEVQSIRNTVASGGGVDPENVTVLDMNNGQAYPGIGDGAFGADSPYARHQREAEEYYRAKILDRLSTYGDVRVAVHVELDKEMVNQTVSDKYDAKPTTLEVSDYSREMTSSRPETGGRPGVVPNAGIGNVAQQVSSPGGAESSTTERREDQRSVAGSTRTVTEKAPFVPTWMGVSIGIPRSYFQRVWLQRSPPEPGQAPKTADAAQLKVIEDEIVKDIQEAVQTLLPKAGQGEDPYPRVAVVPYTETPLPVPEGRSVAETALTWLGSNWQTLGLLLLGGVSIGVLRGMIRSAQAASLPSSEPLGAPLAVEPGENRVVAEAEPAEAAANVLKARFSGTGRNLRDELTELVREDPEAAANVLQNWIGEAA